MKNDNKNDNYDDGVTVSFGAKFARSDQFKTVFREGMALVEAAYESARTSAPISPARLLAAGG